MCLLWLDGGCVSYGGMVGVSIMAGWWVCLLWWDGGCVSYGGMVGVSIKTGWWVCPGGGVLSLLPDQESPHPHNNQDNLENRHEV